MADKPKIVVLGAGSIGGFVGGCWTAAGCEVTMIGRPSFAEAIAIHGMRLTDERGWRHTIAAGEVDYRTDDSVLGEADIIALAVKSGATAAAAEQIAARGRENAIVLSLQNGIGNVDALKEALGDRFRVVRGMVPFNVVYLGDGHFHKGVAGQLLAEDVPAMRALGAAIGPSPAGLSTHGDMLGVAWGKLLINLNNAVNALSGRTLVEQLGKRDYRRVVAASQREGLALLDAEGIVPAKVGAVGPRVLPLLMEAPDWLFRHVFMKKWKIDAKARSSMADDLDHGRATEIDVLQGELVALGDRLGRPTPVNSAVMRLVREAERGGRRDWPPAELRRAVLG